MGHLMEVRNIETYYGPTMAIRGVSFDVPQGEIVTILGANGAGKTTILKTISGIMDPQKGSVTYEGREIQKMDPDRVVGLGISLVPEGRELFPFLSVKGNLQIGAYTRRDHRAVASDLERIFDYFPSLRERAGRPAGMKMILLDEPSLGLSPKLVKEIFEIIVRINRENGTTIVLVEQNANVALQVAHHGYILELGRIVMADTGAALLQKDDVREFYLGIKDKGVRGVRRWKKRKTWR